MVWISLLVNLSVGETTLFQTAFGQFG